jgi:penicillin amidase
MAYHVAMTFSRRRGLSGVGLPVALALSLASLGCSSAVPPLEELPPPPAEGPLGDKLGIDDRLELRGLRAPVDAVRDAAGRTHIYATSLEDALVAEGYLCARDRAPQLEVLRRLSEGRMAEALGHLGATVVASDIGYRHLGLHRVAKKQYELLDERTRGLVDAFGSGVTQHFERIRSGAVKLPDDVTELLPEHFTDWNGDDSLAIGRLQTWLLSYLADQDIELSGVLDDLRATFHAGAGEPGLARRAGLERDLIRFAPPEPATVLAGFDEIGEPKGGAKKSGAPATESAAARARRQALVARTEGYRRAFDLARRLLGEGDAVGSNNWAVAPSRTAGGRAMLASDPHLSLTAPSVFWPVSIHVTPVAGGAADDAVDLAGIAFPGIPGIILGHNAYVAWGATVAVYDVADAYEETLTADGKATLFEGRPVPIETIEEVITVRGAEPVVYDVRVVPHHGPILPVVVEGKVVEPDPSAGAVSVRWTGFEPTNELGAVLGLLRARSVDEALDALQIFGAGAQNWMLADVDGNIGWTTTSLVPHRKPAALAWDPATYQGKLPCLLLPGDGSAEWDGFWERAQLPWAKNPAKGYLATANADQVGVTIDNDPRDEKLPDGRPAFLSCTYAEGFRQGRINDLIETAAAPLTLDDMTGIQSDARSPLGARLTPALVLALDAALAEHAAPGSQPALAEIVKDKAFDAAVLGGVRDALAAWGKEHGYQAASGVDPETGLALAIAEPEARAAQAALLFNAWLVRALRRTFGDELARIGRPSGLRLDARAFVRLVNADPGTLATYDPAIKDSALWDDLDTPAEESRHERMVRAMLDALGWLAKQPEHTGGLESYRWGAFHAVRFLPIVPVWGTLAIPIYEDTRFPRGYQRHGDMFAVDNSNYTLGVGLDQDPDFTYRSGPAQRFVVEMDPAGPRARNAIPGGAVVDRNHAHFSDQADPWRRNAPLALPFLVDDVVGAAERRELLVPKK